MTERIYKCISELYVHGVPQGVQGVCMNLRCWLMNTGKYDFSYEEMSDRELVEYMKEYRGKYLVEVE